MSSQSNRSSGRRSTRNKEPVVIPTCIKCGKGFSNYSALSKHKLTHSNVRNFPCHLCPKAFKRQDHLNGHMLTHRDTKPFECDVNGCDRTYCDARSLRRHKESFHNLSAASVGTNNNKRLLHGQPGPEEGQSQPTVDLPTSSDFSSQTLPLGVPSLTGSRHRHPAGNHSNSDSVNLSPLIHSSSQTSIFGPLSSSSSKVSRFTAAFKRKANVSTNSQLNQQLGFESDQPLNESEDEGVSSKIRKSNCCSSSSDVILIISEELDELKALVQRQEREITSLKNSYEKATGMIDSLKGKLQELVNMF